MRSDKQRSREKVHLRVRTQFQQDRQQTRHHFRPRPRPQQKQTKHKTNELARVNRNQICPFLAQIYYCINSVNNYQRQQQIPKDRKIILYLWMDSTLKQITQILRAYLPVIRTKQRFVFSKVSNEGGVFVKKQIGTVLVHKKGTDNEDIRLDSQNFFIGDFIDVSINYK